ncbi:MAG: tetratricopeptide repeat protein [Steroidobacteraceae bacterium]
MTSVVVQPMDESLMRWDTPVCAVVQGLPRMFDEFIQARISQIALSAGAPLAGKSCSPNFYVFSSPHPDQLLKNLLAHNPGMYDSQSGLGAVEDFLHSRHPVRVWYNSKPGCPGAISGSGPAPFKLRCSDSLDSINLHLSYGDVRSISAAFIVVDMNRMKKITTRELTDYVAMVGLADVRLDADAGAVPTILRLFQNPTRPPQGLSAWDRALLYSLYNTSQSSTLQMSQMEMTVTNRITRPRNLDDTPSRSSNSAIPVWANELLPPPDAKASYWVRIAAEQGIATAQYDQGVRYVLGQGVPRDYAKAAQWFRKAAEQGYADAQLNLGGLYNAGHGVPQDYAKAAEWFSKAAEQGNANAQSSLGVAYANGQGVSQDYAKAIQWYHMAAEQGDANAQRSLGSAYASGQGVPKDYAKAAQWFRKAAVQGDANAQFYLGELYNSGRGVPRDSVRAYKWWILANADSSSSDDVYNWSLSEMKESASQMKPDQLAHAHREASEWLAAHRSAR